MNQQISKGQAFVSTFYSAALVKKCITLFCSLVLSVIITAPIHAETMVTYYHTDMTGSPIAMSNEAGDLLWHEEYTDFGYRVPVGGTDSFSVRNRIGFTGHLEEKVGGRQLVYAQQRFYDPILGRFLSPDKASYEEVTPQTINRFSYALNNPHRYTDPDGEFVFLIPVLVFIAKEVAAEAASRATGGATDFLSVRRMGTKLIKGAGKLIKKARTKTPDNALPPWNGPTDYSSLKNPSDITKSKVTPRQKAEMAEANKKHNGGILRSDADGTPAVAAKQSKRGVTPPKNEIAVDHKDPVSNGGTREFENLQILTREQNGIKSNSLIK